VVKPVAWFDLSSEIRRKYAKRSWIPLRVGRNEREGSIGNADFSQAYEGVHTLLIPLSLREKHEYSWSDDHGDHRSYSFKDSYKTADEYQSSDEEYFGTRLVMRQLLPSMKHPEWHVNQDLVFALELVREGDVWVRPYEGFIDVIRLIREPSGAPVEASIRAEFLRDYLQARGAALRLSSYRERDGMITEEDASSFVKGPEDKEIDGGRLSRRTWEIDDTGGRAGGGVGVFRVFRTDVDHAEDVPVLDPESDANTESEQRSFVRPSLGLWRAIEEYWRDEWIEPAPKSVRVRRDKVPSSVSFIVEADGTTANSDELNYEDVGRWLWFSPTVIPNLLKYRGNELQWYTRETGGISTPSDPSIHFGVNSVGLITVYAEDIASLSEWERKLWAGHNVTPEGGVSTELLSAQVNVEVAETQAPEAFFAPVLQQVDQAFEQKYGKRLFRTHESHSEISSRIHRFRSLEKAGFFELAKDITRLTADLIDIDAVRTALGVGKDDKRGSLKLLQSVLALTVRDEIARNLMSPIFATYELRLADAHLPKSELAEALGMLRIGANDTPLEKGFKLIHAVVSAWNTVNWVFIDNVPDRFRRTTE